MRDLRRRCLLLVLRGVEHSCPHHLEGVTAPFTVLVLGQSVDGLRVSVGDGHVRLEVGHGLFAPVSHCPDQIAPDFLLALRDGGYPLRSEEHTSELQSLMRISYAVFCLK